MIKMTEKIDEIKKTLNDMVKSNETSEFAAPTFMDVRGGSSGIKYLQLRSEEIKQSNPDAQNPLKQAALEFIDQYVKTEYLANVFAFAMNSYRGDELVEQDFDEIGLRYTKACETIREKQRVT